MKPILDLIMISLITYLGSIDICIEILAGLSLGMYCIVFHFILLLHVSLLMIYE